MLPKFILQILLIISFVIFGYNIVYIIRIKKKNKASTQISLDNGVKVETRTIVKFGIMVLNGFIVLVSLNIFFYDFIVLLVPRLPIPLVSEILQVVGFSLVFGGNITLNLAYRELGVHWTYPIFDEKRKRKLINTGIYSRIRHPIYLSFNLFCIGLNLMLLDWILIILYVVGSFGLHIQAIDEEKFLTKYFGQEFLDYKAKTGRYFLKLSRK